MKKNILRILKISLLSLAVLLTLSMVGGYFYFQKMLGPKPNLIQVEKGYSTIPLTWRAGSHSAISALFVPITFKSVPDTFYLQLDLGARSSMLYRAPFSSLRQYYPKLPAVDGHYLKELSFQLGTVTVRADSIMLATEGDALQKDHDFKIIGTLGSDFFHRKKSILNYRSDQLVLLDEVPTHLAEENKIPLTIKNRWVILPATIDGQSTKFMWDTGSSAFDLIVDKTTWQQLVDDPNVFEKHIENSHGKPITVYNGTTNIPVEIGNIPLKIDKVTYTEGFPWWTQLLIRATGMQGMIGNSIFLDQVIYLDLEGKEMAILEAGTQMPDASSGGFSRLED